LIEFQQSSERCQEYLLMYGDRLALKLAIPILPLRLR